MSKLRVLVPLDGSPLAEAILPVVRGFGTPEVTLLHALPQGTAEDSQARLAAEAAVLGPKERLAAQGLADVKSEVVFGAPADAILEAAARHAVGLVALTTHGRSGFDRLVLGSVAEQVVRAAHVPVVTLRTPEAPRDPDARPLFDRVVVPYDGSPLAWRAVEQLALFGAAGKGRLMLFGVLEHEEPSATAFGPPGPAHDPRRAERMARTAELRTELETAAQRAADLGFDVSVDFGAGRPATRIVEWAQSNFPTLIAMGTHGRSGLARLALGSVTEKVLRAADVPLLITR